MKELQIKDKSRRSFLLDCGKMTAIGSVSSILNLTMANKVLAARAPGSITDYKALVCVFLDGGADSFQMLMPGLADYDEFAERRAHFTLNRNAQIPISDERGSQDCLLHANMSGVAGMFKDKDLSFIANIGTLVEPMTKTEYNNRTKKRPIGIASHFDQTLQWQTSIPNERGGSIGWLGRVSDLINDAANNNGTASMNMAVGGNNTLQQGVSTGMFSLSNGVNALEDYKNALATRETIDKQLSTNYTSVLRNHYNHVKKQTIEQSQVLQEYEESITFNAPFPNSSIGNQLKRVAQYIKINGVLGLNRQTFYVHRRGCDHHRGMISGTNGLFTEISQAFTAFNAALKEIGHHDDVITYTASDFGRSLTSNGSGTDHAWGGNSIVMGGPIKGGRILGDYPDMSLDSGTMLGTRGRMLPTTSVDELHASLAKWFGVENANEMPQILPNIRNFYGWQNQNHAIADMFS